MSSVPTQGKTRDKLTAPGVARDDDSRANFKQFFAGTSGRWRNVMRRTELQRDSAGHGNPASNRRQHLTGREERR